MIGPPARAEPPIRVGLATFSDKKGKKKEVFYKKTPKKAIFSKGTCLKKRAPARNDTTTEHRGWVKKKFGSDF